MMKRAVAGLGVCAGLLSVGAVLTAAPAGADCTGASVRTGCAAGEQVARTVTVTVTRTKTTTSTTTTTKTTTSTTTVTATASGTRSASAVVEGERVAPAGTVVAEHPN
ncbi:hypothetical protein [Tsukamurella pseudospumae]|uniref:hypothetical protein n=1 Tax=Tsukamurella pseudospumae TaxID=239498 RepID=UPI0012E86DD3|nr:hypothetical protein [Tsukamurella pseudospumae]